jgi:hypothetical protein
VRWSKFQRQAPLGSASKVVDSDEVSLEFVNFPLAGNEGCGSRSEPRPSRRTRKSRSRAFPVMCQLLNRPRALYSLFSNCDFKGANIDRAELWSAGLVAGDLPGVSEHLAQAQRVLRNPFKRTSTREIQHLNWQEILAVLGAVDSSADFGRRDLHCCVVASPGFR